MTENSGSYVDPNSGAAPQPGGFGGAPAVQQDDAPTDVGADTSSLDDGRPAGNARREEWVAYARGQGADADDLKAQDEGGLSRDELRDKYGV
jgi:hypothetical protein